LEPEKDTEMRHLLAATLLSALAVTGPGRAQTEPQPPGQIPGQIIVTGVGEVEAKPDMATIEIGVETRAPEAADALAENSARMQALFEALTAADIAPEDMQTSRLGLGPVWSDRRDTPDAPPEIAGYVADNQLTVRVRDIGRTGAVIDALASAGANRLSGISFTIAEPRPLRDAALADAVADARAKAELLAESAGVALGRVVSVREQGGASGPIPLQARADMAMEMPIAGGSVGISARVEVVYAVE
jgi:hypothetical protein